MSISYIIACDRNVRYDRWVGEGSKAEINSE